MKVVLNLCADHLNHFLVIGEASHLPSIFFISFLDVNHVISDKVSTANPGQNGCICPNS
jgi:hypothetical protein